MGVLVEGPSRRDVKGRGRDVAAAARSCGGLPNATTRISVLD